jgi:hypothetical protein
MWFFGAKPFDNDVSIWSDLTKLLSRQRERKKKNREARKQASPVYTSDNKQQARPLKKEDSRDP